MKMLVSLADDVLAEIKAYAKSRNIGVGKALSELVWQALHPHLRTRLVNGFHVVDLPAGSPRVTAEDVQKLLDE